MSTLLTSAEYQNILNYDAEQRLRYSLEKIIEHQTLWILIDEHGSVMLNTDDEDCVPVWPLKEFAEAWATGEWQNCQAEAISFAKWKSRWTPGLIEDDLSLVIFPNEQEEGLVLFPDEFEQELTKKAAQFNKVKTKRL